MNCNFLYSQVYNILDQFVPKTKASRISYPPWFTPSIKANLKLKAFHFRRYRKFGVDSDLSEYKRLRSLVKRDIRIKYREYLLDIESKFKTDSKCFWSFVASKRKTTGMPKTMNYGDLIVDNPADILQSFRHFFSQSFIPRSDAHVSESSFSDALTLPLPSFGEDCVLGILKSLKPTFTAGPDRLPSFLLRDCASVLSGPLTKIFNLSLSSQKYPRPWKTAKTRPVYKTVTEETSKTTDRFVYYQISVRSLRKLCLVSFTPTFNI